MISKEIIFSIFRGRLRAGNKKTAAPFKSWEADWKAPSIRQQMNVPAAVSKRRETHRQETLARLYDYCLIYNTEVLEREYVAKPSFRELVGFDSTDVQYIAQAQPYEPLTVIVLTDGSIIDECGRKRTDLEIIDEY